jgi:hypothetical protein
LQQPVADTDSGSQGGERRKTGKKLFCAFEGKGIKRRMEGKR